MEQKYLTDFYNELIIKQDYFECHEIAEDYWKSNGNFSKVDAEVFLIQISTGEYHYRRGNLTGAKKCYSKAIELLEEQHYNLDDLGLTEQTKAFLNHRLADILNHVPFKPPNIPLTESMLNMLYIQHGQHIEEHAFIASIYENHVTHHNIVHKHLVRDRTSVNQAREEALRLRQKRSHHS
ncbi:DUF309 domain-containing protein [Aliicoccus persicus]|uniref:DUF309 domain-containing protein n=1 Tax=Aliicoccus persicus TaxID=930138 RepID=A0A662Z3B4_9STAP|nr:DUF309 domain-containing protein [Aliicoccus persicus]SEV83896.1 hypothetical protein SAMN05192557_0381 [Aliicoccus persicus]